MAESSLFSLTESFLTKVASRAVEEASLALGVYDDLTIIWSNYKSCVDNHYFIFFKKSNDCLVSKRSIVLEQNC